MIEDLTTRLERLEKEIELAKYKYANLKWCCEQFGIRFGKPEIIKAPMIVVDKKKMLDVLKEKIRQEIFNEMKQTEIKIKE